MTREQHTVSRLGFCDASDSEASVDQQTVTLSATLVSFSQTAFTFFPRLHLSAAVKPRCPHNS